MTPCNFYSLFSGPIFKYSHTRGSGFNIGILSGHGSAHNTSHLKNLMEGGFSKCCKSRVIPASVSSWGWHLLMVFPLIKGSVPSRFLVCWLTFWLLLPVCSTSLRHGFHLCCPLMVKDGRWIPRHHTHNSGSRNERGNLDKEAFPKAPRGDFF